MTKLRKGKDNKYYITRPKKFSKDGVLCTSVVKQVFDFAFNMSFGELGEHRSNRSGGQIRRKNGEIFANTFQGKLAEFAVKDLLRKKGIFLPNPDLDVYGLGNWDNYDFIYNNYKIAIKSTKHYGQLLLLETKDWNYDGEYVPNKQKSNDLAIYNFFILVRIKPSVENIMKENNLLYNNRICNSISSDKDQKEIIIQEYNTLKEIFGMIDGNSNFKIEYDIPGVISHKTLKYIIKHNYVLPKNSILRKTRMDAENYYIQVGSMRDFRHLIEGLKS